MSKIKTLALDIGHNNKYDRGANGIRSEDSLNLQVGNRVLERLREVSINVVDCTPEVSTSLTNSLQTRCDRANEAGAELFISIHHNACPGGHGCEAYCISGGLAERVSREVLGEISSLGFSNRGVKEGFGLYVIRNTVMPAILLECAFVDSSRDMDGYDPIKVGDAIFNGLVRALDLEGSFKERFYVVVPGDTLWGISRRLNISVDTLVALNSIGDRNLIRVGERLRYN